MAEITANPARCLNCGARLEGQYCGECGQRASKRRISLFELLREAFGDLFELDSRLWRTLRPLLLRPGLLTKDYLEGRRQRYMPPFRMYLVLSLVFFVIAFFDPREDFALLYEEDAATPSEVSGEPSEAAAEEAAQARRVLEELAAEGVVDPAVVDPESADGIDIDTEADDGINVSVNGDGVFDNCDELDIDIPDSSILRSRLTPERLPRACERWNTLGPQALARALLDRIPAALLVLLPAMALVLKILHPLSGRYYVEHLLFLVHFHSFFFLILTLQILWSRFVAVSPLPGAAGVLPVVASSLYIPVYLHKAMRRVYGQNGPITFMKFLVLAIIYLLGFLILLLSALLLTFISV